MPLKTSKKKSIERFRKNYCRPTRGCDYDDMTEDWMTNIDETVDQCFLWTKDRRSAIPITNLALNTAKEFTNKNGKKVSGREFVKENLTLPIMKKMCKWGLKEFCTPSKEMTEKAYDGSVEACQQLYKAMD